MRRFGGTVSDTNKMTEVDRVGGRLGLKGVVATAFNINIPSDKVTRIALKSDVSVGWVWSTTKFFIQIVDDCGKEIDFFFPEYLARRHMRTFEKGLPPHKFYVWKYGTHYVLARKAMSPPAIIEHFVEKTGPMVFTYYLGDYDVITLDRDEVNAFREHFNAQTVEPEDWANTLAALTEGRYHRESTDDESGPDDEESE